LKKSSGRRDETPTGVADALWLAVRRPTHGEPDGRISPAAMRLRGAARQRILQAPNSLKVTVTIANCTQIAAQKWFQEVIAGAQLWTDDSDKRIGMAFWEAWSSSARLVGDSEKGPAFVVPHGRGANRADRA
jgi:hypothetical protein